MEGGLGRGPSLTNTFSAGKDKEKPAAKRQDIKI